MGETKSWLAGQDVCARSTSILCSHAHLQLDGGSGAPVPERLNNASLRLAGMSVGLGSIQHQTGSTVCRVASRCYSHLRQKSVLCFCRKFFPVVDS